MNKLWVIIKREYLQVVKKKSFLIGIILTPIMMSALMILPAWLAKSKSTEAEKLAIIDQSGVEVGHKFAESLEQYTLEETDEPYYIITRHETLATDDSSGVAKLETEFGQLIYDKELKYFLVIKPEAHLSDTNIYLVTNSDNFVSLRRFERQLSNILSSIRLNETNINLAVDSVMHLTRTMDLPVRDTLGEETSFGIKYFTGMVFVGLLFGMIVGYGQLVMRSIIEEKNSRVMEVLVSSASPFQLMLGKILGLCAANLSQMAIWLLLGSVLYLSRGSVDIDPGIYKIVFNPVVIIFFFLFMLSGYLLFSTLFALVGAIVNTEKEAQSFIMPITMTNVIPFMLAIHVVQEPNSTLSTVLSFIPLLTPTMMMMRVVFVAPSVTDYSLFSGIVGEATLGFIILCVTTVGLIWVTAKIFRVGILMYGKRPTLPEIIKWVRY